MPREIPTDVRQKLLERQRDEITEYHIYTRLAQQTRDAENRATLQRIAEMERAHYETWRALSGTEVPPHRFKVWLYVLLGRILGLTFTLRLMEQGEEKSQAAYAELARIFPEAERIWQEEQAHEEDLLAMLDEDILHYVGSVVLGLNDALVELTGALAGLTLALQNGPLIALTGLITGIAAALSMAASEYLSTKAEPESGKNPLKAAFYTGVAYLFTVAVLISPYLFNLHYIISLILTLTLAIGIIALFNFYVSVAQGGDFKRSFLEMSVLSLSVAAFSFAVGYLLRTLFGIEV